MKFIFEVTVNPGYDPERYAAAWVEASRSIQQARDTQGTYLHCDLDNPDRLLAVAPLGVEGRPGDQHNPE